VYLFFYHFHTVLSCTSSQTRSPVEQTILYAISLGGDTDTIATMAAAMGGAFYGLDSMPQSWLDCCEGVHDARKQGEGIAELIGKSSHQQ
jgi:poly(ADP-ribose) glycohydrolase ARH3